MRATVPSKKHMAEVAKKHGQDGFVFVGIYNKDGSQAFSMHGPISKAYADKMLELALSRRKQVGAKEKA